jgi:hypothetical protein
MWKKYILRVLKGKGMRPLQRPGNRIHLAQDTSFVAMQRLSWH